MIRTLATLFAALMLAACTQPSSRAPATEPETMPGETGNCPVRNPKNIEAWINAMPGMNDNPTLIVQFTATAPTPGDTFTLDYASNEGGYSRIAELNLYSSMPLEPVIQVETETDIRVEMPNFYRDEIEALRIYCAGELLLSLDDVITAY